MTSTQLVSDCDPALPPAGVAFTATMDAADASAFCWEVSDQVGAMRYPFNLLYCSTHRRRGTCRQLFTHFSPSSAPETLACPTRS